jgi:hypothetical protein
MHGARDAGARATTRPFGDCFHGRMRRQPTTCVHEILDGERDLAFRVLRLPVLLAALAAAGHEPLLALASRLEAAEASPSERTRRVAGPC